MVSLIELESGSLGRMVCISVRPNGSQKQVRIQLDSVQYNDQTSSCGRTFDLILLQLSHFPAAQSALSVTEGPQVYRWMNREHMRGDYFCCGFTLGAAFGFVRGEFSIPLHWFA